VDADISASTAIADTKLATLSTADKVADPALSANVALLNRSPQAFTGGTNSFIGRVGIGTSSPAVRLHLKQATDNSGFGAANDGIRLEAASGESWGMQTQSGGDLVFDSGLGSGYAYISRNGGQFNITSDARFKKNVQPLTSTLERVLQLRPVSFQYLQAPDESKPIIGFLAQEVQPFFPAVVDVKDGYLAIGYGSFGPIAIGAIQGLNEKLEVNSQKAEDSIQKLQEVRVG
jgi:hypothetical protein